LRGSRGGKGGDEPKDRARVSVAKTVCCDRGHGVGDPNGVNNTEKKESTKC
jgi:hypothetical protein